MRRLITRALDAAGGGFFRPGTQAREMMMLTFSQFVQFVTKLARERKLRQMIHTFQNEGDPRQSNLLWEQIEKEVFGVEWD